MSSCMVAILLARPATSTPERSLRILRIPIPPSMMNLYPSLCRSTLNTRPRSIPHPLLSLLHRPRQTFSTTSWMMCPRISVPIPLRHWRSRACGPAALAPCWSSPCRRPQSPSRARNRTGPVQATGQSIRLESEGISALLLSLTVSIALFRSSSLSRSRTNDLNNFSEKMHAKATYDL